MLAVPINRSFADEPDTDAAPSTDARWQVDARWRDADVPLRIAGAEVEIAEFPEPSDEDERHQEWYIG